MIGIMRCLFCQLYSTCVCCGLSVKSRWFMFHDVLFADEWVKIKLGSCIACFVNFILMVFAVAYLLNLCGSSFKMFSLSLSLYFGLHVLLSLSLAACSSVNEVCQETSDVAFNSVPAMHINEQLVLQESKSIQQNQQMLPSDYNGKVLSEQFQAQNACEASMGLNLNMDYPLPQQIEYYAQRKYFASHWSTEAVTAALEVSIVLFFFFFPDSKR